MKFYLTTPLYYVNSRPHIGHAYTEIASDALARWHRLTGKDVFFLTGTDEHGQKIARAAAAAGKEPQAFTDDISQTFRDLWKTLGVEYDDFIRTTEGRHKEAVKKVWLELEKKGELYTSAYRGYYCTPCETFLAEESVRQMKAEGKDVLCPDCSRAAEEIEETNYFFKLSKYQDWLARSIEAGKDVDTGAALKILPETRKNEVLGFLRNNKLEDLCVSRPKNRLAWGIPVPLSADHVTYVWFDALVNYISACGYGSDETKLAKWWPADAHLIGKDILRHHAIYWTILLKALGIAPPKLIFAHGWWVVDGKKMSKSLGNAMDPVEIVAHYGVDAFRYFLLAETPFGQDGSFSEDALITRFNNDLANDIGNLLNRSLTMCEKYFEGTVPPLGNSESLLQSPAYAESKAMGTLSYELVDKLLPEYMDRLGFSEALAGIWSLIGMANKYIEKTAPWTLAKEGKTEELQCVIRTLVYVLRDASKMVYPFIPGKAQGIWEQLGRPGSPADEPFSKTWTGLDGTKIAKGAPLFPRIDTGEEKKGDKKKAAKGQ